MHSAARCVILFRLTQETEYPGVAQLVARLTGGQEAVSSSLATRTKKPIPFRESVFFFPCTSGTHGLLPRALRAFPSNGRSAGRGALRRCAAVSSSLATRTKTVGPLLGFGGFFVCWFRELTASCRALCARFHSTAVRPNAAPCAAVRPCVQVSRQAILCFPFFEASPRRRYAGRSSSGSIRSYPSESPPPRAAWSRRRCCREKSHKAYVGSGSPSRSATRECREESGP